MIYSVFDWRVGRYRYYEGAGEGLGVRPQGVKINDDAGHHQLEDVLPRVPAGAQIIGEGDEPRGRIAVLPNMPGRSDAAGSTINGFGDFAADPNNPLVKSPWLTLGLWAASVWVAFRVAEWVGKQAERGF